MKAIHEVLKEKRLETGITQKIIAEHIGVNHCTYSNYENGRIRLYGDTLLELMVLFDIKLDELTNRKYDENVIFHLLKLSEESKGVLPRK